MESANQVLQLIAHLVTIGGVPIAIYMYRAQKLRERREREELVFDELGDKYEEFMQLCLRHPNADVFAGAEESEPSSQLQLNVEHALFAVLISLFERAYLMFKDQHAAHRERQWAGWVLFMESYVIRRSFQRVWNAIGLQFDSEYVAFLNNLIQSCGKTDNNAVNLSGEVGQN